MAVMEKTNKGLMQLVKDYERKFTNKPSIPIEPPKVEFGKRLENIFHKK